MLYSKKVLQAGVLLMYVPFLAAKIVWQDIESHVVNAVCQFHVVTRDFDYVVPYRPKPFKQSRGSGFFISPDGLIITNSHVVQDAVAIWITLPGCGKTKIPVHILGHSPKRDVALVKLTDEGFQLVCENLGVSEMFCLEFGDSDTVHRLDKVVAVGYPLGQDRLKGTKGVISGPYYSPHHESLIQMDAAINPGNSGGPLLNSEGKVVGINSNGFLQAQNVGYIVPINHVKTMLDDLQMCEIVHRPYLGIYCNLSTNEHAKYLGNPTPAGLYVYYAQPDAIAGRAGIQPGDMLYKIDGYEIDEHGETKVPWASEKVPIDEVVARFKPGQMVTFEVYRRGQRLPLSAECEQPPDHSSDQQYGPVDYEVLGGMSVMQLCKNHFELLPMNPYLLAYERPEKQNDLVLVITSVVPGTEIHKNGQLYPSALIAEVNELPVRTVDEFRDAVMVSLETGILVIKTEGDQQFVFSLEQLLKDQYKLIQDRICPPTKLFMALSGNRFEMPYGQ